MTQRDESVSERLRSYPPLCITCSKFVKVETAARYAETGDYGQVYGYEFECRKCVDARKARRDA